jgi:hypothetical protein
MRYSDVVDIALLDNEKSINIPHHRDLVSECWVVI